MKRLLMLEPYNCASGDTREGNIYDIIEDTLIIFKPYKDEEEYNDSENYEYTKENIEKYSQYEQTR
ncbi:MAG: hypothetical protein PHT02_01000 [Tissierellia bacterium]|nr:hypothetical protein [Tissierellia bacterium]